MSKWYKIYKQLKTDNEQGLMEEEDSSVRRKTQQAYRLGKRNVLRFSLKSRDITQEDLFMYFSNFLTETLMYW